MLSRSAFILGYENISDRFPHGDALISGKSQTPAALSETDKKEWRYKALAMVEILPPFLQADSFGERYVCVRVTNHLPFLVESVWFHFENQDEPISPRYRDNDWSKRYAADRKASAKDWLIQDIAAGETRMIWIRRQMHIRGDPGISVIQTMHVPDIDLCAYWPVKKKEADPWKCNH